MRNIIAALGVVVGLASPAAAHLPAGTKCDTTLRNCKRSARSIHRVWNVNRNAHRAISIAACESGLRWWVWNGQYFGTFQMGESERATYGYGKGPLRQARGARRYWQVSGWSPWSCA